MDADPKWIGKSGCLSVSSNFHQDKTTPQATVLPQRGTLLQPDGVVFGRAAESGAAHVTCHPAITCILVIIAVIVLVVWSHCCAFWTMTPAGLKKAALL